MKYAVAFMNYFDNDLIVDIVEADNIKEAITKHRAFGADDLEWLIEIPDDMEGIKQYFFDTDLAIDVVEIT